MQTQYEVGKPKQGKNQKQCQQSLAMRSDTLFGAVRKASLRFYAVLMGFMARYSSIMTRIHMSWIPTWTVPLKIATANLMRLIEQSKSERADGVRAAGILVQGQRPNMNIP